MKSLRASWLCVLGMILVQPVDSDEASGRPAVATTPTDPSAAVERYTKLMEQAAGAGHCPIAEVFKRETLESLRAFAAAVEFIDLEPTKPIRVTLPEGYFNPRGRTISFDSFDLAIEQKNLTHYIAMSKTARGVLLESNVSILKKDGNILCLRDISTTIGFKASAPPGAQEKANQ